MNKAASTQEDTFLHTSLEPSRNYAGKAAGSKALFGRTC